MFKFCRIGKTNLVCYPSGLILRFHKYQKKWQICKGYKEKNGYLRMEIDSKPYYKHRVLSHAFGILDLHSELQIDHIDLNKSNNNISNFRPVTNQQNQFNMNAKGCTKRKNKWEAQIRLDGKYIYLGLFDTKEEAHQAYLDAKPIYHKF